MRIARRFNAGIESQDIASPEGTTEVRGSHAFSRPFGTFRSSGRFPALKRRAIFTRSLRDALRVTPASNPSPLFSAKGGTSTVRIELASVPLHRRADHHRLLRAQVGKVPAIAHIRAHFHHLVLQKWPHRIAEFLAPSTSATALSNNRK